MKLFIFNEDARDRKNNGTFPRMSPIEVVQKDFLLNKEKIFNDFFPENVFFSPLIPKYLGDNPSKIIQSIADLHTWTEREPKGLMYVVSEKLKDLLSRFNLAPHRFYAAQVLFENQLIEYYVFHITSNYYEQIIDFKNSTFCNWSFIKKIKLGDENIKVNSINEIYKISEEKDWDKWGFNKAALKPEFNDLDLCWFTNLGIIISEKLKNAIESADLTGIEITECPVEFEVSIDSDE